MSDLLSHEERRLGRRPQLKTATRAIESGEDAVRLQTYGRDDTVLERRFKNVVRFLKGRLDPAEIRDALLRNISRKIRLFVNDRCTRCHRSLRIESRGQGFIRYIDGRERRLCRRNRCRRDGRDLFAGKPHLVPRHRIAVGKIWPRIYVFLFRKILS